MSTIVPGLPGSDSRTSASPIVPVVGIDKWNATSTIKIDGKDELVVGPIVVTVDQFISDNQFSEYGASPEARKAYLKTIQWQTIKGAPIKTSLPVSGALASRVSQLQAAWAAQKKQEEVKATVTPSKEKSPVGYQHGVYDASSGKDIIETLPIKPGAIVTGKTADGKDVVGKLGTIVKEKDGMLYGYVTTFEGYEGGGIKMGQVKVPIANLQERSFSITDDKGKIVLQADK